MRTEIDNVGFLLAKASQRFNERLVERFAKHGFAEVRPAYGSVLMPLFAQDGLRIGGIGARSRLSKQSMTRLVAQCEALTGAPPITTCVRTATNSLKVITWGPR